MEHATDSFYDFSYNGFQKISDIVVFVCFFILFDQAGQNMEDATEP